MSEVLPYWNDTVTVCNKLSSKDSVTKMDVWKTTVLHFCFFKQEVQHDFSGTTVSIGTSSVCRIPKSENAGYKPYYEWKNDISAGFTLSVGDYIFKGELTEEINADNIVSVYNAHKPDAILVKAVSDNSDFMGLAEHYRAEGV